MTIRTMIQVSAFAVSIAIGAIVGVDPPNDPGDLRLLGWAVFAWGCVGAIAWLTSPASPPR